ncbi:hypothetical protein BXT84_00445 [Sulfobacillus thermotolerans]|uniref:Helix-turn-helix domain-containing protein n=1 Tax=Sulfobacillus thermotolerans TaxID=338644 RepID=A0ABM6RMP1_9FIRM|nr:hypothetical protein BXT84_00445 [Sulfobacillus thermotolerans]
MATMTPPPFTVNIAQSLDTGTEGWHHQIFVKLYTAALTTGFFAEISDRDWKTLCVLALHMDAQGQCYPSRDAIARALGVNKSTASDRIRSLLAFRWQDQPIVQATRPRRPDGTLGRQVYTILPIAPFGFGPNPARPAAAIPSSESEVSIRPAMSGNGDMAPDHHVGVSQLGLFQLGESRPLQTRSRINKNQRKQDPGSREKDLPPDPSTPSESQDLTPQGVPGPIAVPASDTERARSVKGLRSLTPAPGTDPRHNVSQRDNRDTKPSSQGSGRPLSSAVTVLAERLKQRLQDHGVTIFPRNWHAKASTGAEVLLQSLSVAEAEELMDWALAHPYWGAKTTSMQRLVGLAAEWQQSRARPSRAVPLRTPGSTTVEAQNMALLRRLYTESLPQREEAQGQ